MKTNHTPAPWFAVQYANCFDIQSEQGYCLNNVLDLEQDDNAEANARLIASAPTMYEFIQKLRLEGFLTDELHEEANQIINSLKSDK